MNMSFRKLFGRPVLIALLSVLVVFAGLALPHIAYADSSSDDCGWQSYLTGSLVHIGSCLTGYNAGSAAGSLFKGLGLSALNAVAYVFLELASWLMALAGMFLNSVLFYGVIQFGKYFGNTATLLAAWKILRDFSNIFLIFGFVMMGMATILNIHSYEVKKTLPRLIIFAVLLNFSLLAAETIIDVSNIVSVNIYNQAGACGQGAQSGVGGFGSNGSNGLSAGCSSYGLSGIVAQDIGISSIFDPGIAQNIKQDDPNTTVSIIMSTILVIVVCVTFFAAGIMLLIRIVTLVFLMVLSPFGFAGMAIPSLEGYAKRWWSLLISNAFFAPVFLLTLAIGLKLATGLIATGQNNNLISAVASPSNSLGQVVLIYIIIIGFIYGSLVIAKSMGAYGANFATKMGGAVTLGAVSYVGTQTGGRAFQRGSEIVRESKFGRTAAGRFVAETLGRGGNATFDPRSIKGLSSIGGLDLGKAGKGYKDRVHDAEKSRTEYSETLEKTEAEKKKAEANKEETKKTQEEQKKEVADLDTQQKIERKELQDRIDAQVSAYQAARGTPDEARQSLSLNNLLLEQQNLRDVHAKRMSQMQQEHKQVMDNVAAQAKAIKEAPQREFAERLVKPLPQPFQFIYKYGTAGSAADHHAAEKILKDLDKSELQKLTSALSKVTSATGGGGHAPAAAAPATPPPSAGGGGGGGGGHH